MRMRMRMRYPVGVGEAICLEAGQDWTGQDRIGQNRAGQGRAEIDKWRRADRRQEGSGRRAAWAIDLLGAGRTHFVHLYRRYIKVARTYIAEENTFPR